MQKNQNKKVRWDPITAKLAESNIKQEIYMPIPKQHTAPTKKANKTNATKAPKNKATETNSTEERLSNEEFSNYLKSLFADDTLPFKYQNPDAWILYKRKKRKKTWYF